MAPMEPPTFSKTKGFADGGGQEYEIKVAALLFLRALQHAQKFYIATNMEDAGAFDDLVITYKLKHSAQWNSCFVQLKHKTNKQPISMHSLTTFKNKGDFKLIKYCKSYNEIKRRFQTSGDENPVFRGDFNHSEYVIFTNATMDLQLSQKQRQSSCYTQLLLQANEDIGAVFSFSENSDQDLYQYFQDLLKLRDFLESLDFKTLSEEELGNRIEEFKTAVPVSKQLSVTLDSRYSSQEIQHIKSELRDLKSCNNFLHDLYFFVGQPNEENMDDILQKEIQKYFCTNDVDTKSICRELYDNIAHWWRKENYCLTETAIFWQRIIHNRLSILSKHKNEKMNSLGVKFEKDCLLTLPKTSEINIVTKWPLLTCLKICQGLNKPHIVIGLKSLVHLKKEVLALWPTEWCTTLVLDWEYVEHNVDYLYVQHPSRMLIIVSQEPIKCSYSFIDEAVFSHFDVESQHKIQQKEVMLQGFKVTLKDLLTESTKHLINEDMLLQILKSSDVTVGRSLQIGIECFIPRSLIHHIYMKKSILSKSEFSAVLALSGVLETHISNISPGGDICMIEYTTENCFQFVAVDVKNYDKIPDESAEDIYIINTERKVDPNLCRFVTIRDSKEFKLLCEKYRNMHWINLQEDEKLVWKESKGDFSLIQKYADDNEGVCYNQDQLLCLPDRVVVVIAEPGMGKSTLVSELCILKKIMFPTKWVIPVYLNDHTHILDKYANREKSVDFMKELLRFAAGVCDSELEKSLFNIAMQDMKNIIVLLDGVDEISPTYTSTVCSFIRNMMKTEISQIWITSRPIMKEILEKELCVVSYNLLPFSVDEQLLFLENYWTIHDRQIDAAVTREFANRLLQITTQNFSDGDLQFMGIPLQARMMAESFQHHLIIFKDTGKVDLPEKINLIELFNQFVKFKFNIFIKQKMKIDPTNVAFRSTCGKYYEEFNEMHTVCSLAILVSESHRSLLEPKDILRNLEAIVNKIETGSLNIGIIHRIVNKKPHFIHRSFAEYFCALWLKKNYLKNKKFLRKCLCQPELQVMLRMMNYMISENLELHMAVLSKDIKKLRNLLQKGMCVDQRDNCGRSALHLTSFYNYRDIAEELLINGANIYIKDYLKYDPLDYSDMNRSWDTADLLLHYSKNTVGLTQKTDRLILLKQNITDPNYGIDALSVSAKKGYLDLARYLQRNGLDLRKTVLNSRKQTAVHIAVINKHFEMLNIIFDRTSSPQWHKVRLLLKTVLQINYKDLRNDAEDIKDEFGYTPLMYACQNFEFLPESNILTSHLSALECLLKNQSNINATNLEGETALHLASSGGCQDIVKSLLNQNADINIADNYGYTPLHVATIEGHLPVVRQLVQNETILNTIDLHGHTPLHIAAWQNHVQLVVFMLEHQAEVNLCNKQGQTALYLAAREGHKDIVKCLVVHGADVNVADSNGYTPLHISTLKGHLPIVKNSVQKKALSATVNLKSRTPLHSAASRDHLSVAKCLLEHQAGVNICDKKNQTALYIAAREGHQDIVECLVTHGADINRAVNDGYTPLHIATIKGHLSVIKCLVQNEALLNTVNYFDDTPLHSAALRGLLSIVNYLSEHQAIIDMRNKKGQTALYIAAREGHRDVVECLLKHGADINVIENYGYTPLHVATFKGHLSIVKDLLQYALSSPADSNVYTIPHTPTYRHHFSVEHFSKSQTGINTCDIKGQTALYIAASEGHQDIVECLVTHSADINKADKDGYTPLHIAAFKGNLSVVKYLVNNQALLNTVNFFGDTLLHSAAWTGKFCVVEYLLQHQIELDACNKSEQTALYLAAFLGYLPIVECLVSHGADTNIADKNGETALQIATIKGHESIVKYLVQNKDS
ncbi:uncharacterized protein [Periplaneta americana]|uniref:uncharacterized protein n=1 Tax=Periplaneta americana TaxID=6978 RepID=UPI0037E745B0